MYKPAIFKIIRRLTPLSLPSCSRERTEEAAEGVLGEFQLFWSRNPGLQLDAVAYNTLINLRTKGILRPFVGVS